MLSVKFYVSVPIFWSTLFYFYFIRLLYEVSQGKQKRMTRLYRSVNSSPAESRRAGRQKKNNTPVQLSPAGAWPHSISHPYFQPIANSSPFPPHILYMRPFKPPTNHHERTHGCVVIAVNRRPISPAL